MTEDILCNVNGCPIGTWRKIDCIRRIGQRAILTRPGAGRGGRWARGRRAWQTWGKDVLLVLVSLLTQNPSFALLLLIPSSLLAIASGVIFQGPRARQ